LRRRVLALLLLLAATAAGAQSNVVRIVVPFAAGGTTDILARALAPELQRAFGQPFIIDNKPGAGGVLANEIVANAPADGYTLLVVSIANAAHPALYKLPYDPHKAFDAVAMFVTSPNTLAVNPSLPAKTVKEFIALAKAKPGDIQYASGGIGGSLHLAMESFKIVTKTDILHVPFRGAGPAGIDVIAGNTKALIAMVEKERDEGITLTTLGFGQGNYNEAMMEQVADHGNGNYAYIDSALEAQKVLAEQMSSTLFTIAKDVKIQVEFNPAKVSQYRLLGYENRALREEDFNNDRVDAGDIGAGHQVTAIYEIVPAGAKGWVEPRRYGDYSASAGAKGAELAYVKLRYKLPDGTTSKLIERAVPASLLASAAPPRGDMAFATAVAAFGQKLRGDPLLGELSYGRIAALANGQRDFYRQEFAKLVAMAGSLDQRGGEETAAR